MTELATTKNLFPMCYAGININTTPVITEESAPVIKPTNQQTWQTIHKAMFFAVYGMCFGDHDRVLTTKTL